MVRWNLREQTRAMTSRVAMVRISAHETLFLHVGFLSTSALALITVSNPSPAKDRLSGWSFSAVLLPVEEIITEASQPCECLNHTNNKVLIQHRTSILGFDPKKWMLFLSIYNLVFTWTKQSWKKRRRVAGTVTKVCLNFVLTTPLTMFSTLGQMLA